MGHGIILFLLPPSYLFRSCSATKILFARYDISEYYALIFVLKGLALAPAPV